MDVPCEDHSFVCSTGNSPVHCLDTTQSYRTVGCMSQAKQITTKVTGISLAGGKFPWQSGCSVFKILNS